MRAPKRVPLEQVVMDPDEAISRLQEDRVIGLDLETGGLSPWRDPIAVVSMYGEQSGTTAVLHVRGDIPPRLKEFLGEAGRLYIGHNLTGFDVLFLALNGVNVERPSYYCTLIGECVSVSTGRRDVRLNLQDTLNRRVGKKIAKGYGESQWMAQSLTPEQLNYCVEDICYLPVLRDSQLEKVEGTSQERAMVFEQALAPIVVKMVLNGLPFSESALLEYREILKERQARANMYIAKLCGPHFNVNSPKQVREQFEHLGAELEHANFEILTALAEWYTPLTLEEQELWCQGSGASSLNGDTPQHISTLAKNVLISRQAKKREGMYDDEWVGKFVQSDGRVHARFWQVSTDTGRFSSSDPNLQQIPRDGRMLFGDLPAHRIVAVDYSGLEIRVAAALSNDHMMRKALESGDIHRTIASNLFHKPEDQISTDERSLAKAATFTLLFGGSANGLVRYAKMSGSSMDRTEAAHIVSEFFKTYSATALTRQKAMLLASSGRPVPLELPTGLRRVLVPQSDEKSGRAVIKPSQILNTTVQGSAAAGLKSAIFECERRGLMKYIGATVHDELVACVPEKEVEDFTAELSDAMIVGMERLINIPIKVETKVGARWKS